jgi:hypothetical protein
MKIADRPKIKLSSVLHQPAAIIVLLCIVYGTVVLSPFAFGDAAPEGQTGSVQASSPSPSKQGKSNIAYKPLITAAVDVKLADGSGPRYYPSANGVTLWSPNSGLPIVKGDKVSMTVFVATGPFELQQIKVKIDNSDVVTINKQPWKVDIDTNQYSLGYHSVEIWAQSNSPAPESSSDQSVIFYLANTADIRSTNSGDLHSIEANNPAPPQGAVVTQSTSSGLNASTLSGSSNEILSSETNVKTISGQTGSGQTGANSGGTPSNSDDTLKVPLPNLLIKLSSSSASSLQLSSSGVVVSSGDTAKSIDLIKPIDVKVLAPDKSTARRFIYAIYRNGQIVFETDQFLPASMTVIRLQAASKKSGGLLPGGVVLRVWGVDQENRYGLPAVLNINVSPGNGTEESIK